MTHLRRILGLPATLPIQLSRRLTRKISSPCAEYITAFESWMVDGDFQGKTSSNNASKNKLPHLQQQHLPWQYLPVTPPTATPLTKIPPIAIPPTSRSDARLRSDACLRYQPSHFQTLPNTISAEFYVQLLYETLRESATSHPSLLSTSEAA